MKHIRLSASRGFTLIELLAAIAIVGILAVVLINLLNPFAQLNKSRDAKRKSDLEAVQKALELYYQDNGAYPLSSATGRIMGQSGEIAWGSNGFSPYMAVLPQDPVGSKRYYYYSATGQAYYLFTSLDRGGKDPNSCNPSQTQNTPCLNATTTGANCGSGQVCTFGVSSPNVSPNSN